MPLAQLPAEPQNAEIAAARTVIALMPDSPSGYTQLAAALIRSARQTGNFSTYAGAQAAVDRALEIAPADVSAQKLQASLMLTRHRFDEALGLGTSLNAELPNDPFIYGVLTDANAELGNYADAVEWAQKMVDLKPNSASYARVAHLRSLYGDHKGAVEMYTMAARTADPSDREAQSWCLSQLGGEYWRRGKFPAALAAFEEALSLLPDHLLALAGKGRTMAAMGDLTAAAIELEKAVRIAPQTATVVLLGDVYTRAGNLEKAAAQYDLAQAGSQKLGEGHDAHRLALYWADNDLNLDVALKIARDDHAKQNDLYAADTLAWCLFKKGELTEARSVVKEALRLGPNDALILYHAGMIEKELGNTTEAVRLLRLASEINSEFDLIQAEKLRATLRGV